MNANQRSGGNQVLGCVVMAAVFAVALLLWGYGFELVCKALAGSWVEAVLNWLSRMWFWLTLGLVALGLLLSVVSKRE